MNNVKTQKQQGFQKGKITVNAIDVMAAMGLAGQAMDKKTPSL